MSTNKKQFKGEVERPFKINFLKGKKIVKKSYYVGDEFSTTNEKLFHSLINKKRIKQ
jgi:hypothetical protein